MYVRPYRPGDLDSLYALDAACFAAPFRFSRATMRSVVTRREAVVLLACETMQDGTELLLGFCAASMLKTRQHSTGYINTLDVAPGVRGRGVGQRLMIACELALTAAGAGTVRLHVSTENAPAIRLYERLGYVRIRQEDSFYAPEHDALLYIKQLT